MKGRGRLLFRLITAIAAIAIVIVIAPKQTPLDAVWQLAGHMLKGEIGFAERTEWWEMYERNGRFYLPYAPLAAVVLMPLAALFGTEKLGLPVLNALLLLGSALLLWKFLANRRRTRPIAEIAALAYLFATPLLASISTGTVWYLLHSEGNLFLFAALLCRQKHRWFAFGFFVALAIGCRNGLLPSLLGLALLLGKRPKRYIWALAGAAVPTAVALWLNWLAAGSFRTTTYQLAYAEWKMLPVYATSNLPINAPFYFLSYPVPEPRWPYLNFNTEGNALWTMSPFFLLLLLSRPWRTREGRAFALAAVCTFVPYLFFRWHGERQVGTRYTTDLFPFLFPLLAEAAVARKTWLYRGLWIVLLLLALYINMAASVMIKQNRLVF